MTDLLDRAFALASELPEADRVAIATALLHEIATRKSTVTVETQEFPDTEALAYMEQQLKIFTQNKEDLLQRYSGLYILFENGQVLDSDKDEPALVLRAYEARGLKPLFIKKVVPVEPRLNIRGFTPLIIST